MSDFEDALRKGLEAHRSAKQAKKEIFQTFEELSSAVGALTGQRVVVEASRVEKVSIIYPLVSAVQRTQEYVANQLREEEMPDGLFASRVGGEHSKRAQLCKLNISPHGYPVEITIAGRFLHASDRDQLRGALAQILEHPDVAGKIARVAELRGATPALPSGDSDAALVREVAEDSGAAVPRQIAEQAMPLLQAVTQAERMRGYRLVMDSLLRDEELDAQLRSFIRATVLDPTRPYPDRAESLRILIHDQSVEDLAGELARTWFEEAGITRAFSAVISGAFDRRALLPSLLGMLERVVVPEGGEPPDTSDVASHGHRLSEAFSSIRNALVHDVSEPPLSPEMRAQIVSLRERYKSVASLGPMLQDIDQALV